MKVRHKVRGAQKEYFNEKCKAHLQQLNPQQQWFWKFQKIICNDRRPIPPFYGERGIVFEEQDKAQTFADGLAGLCRLNIHKDVDDDKAEEIEDEVRRLRRR